MSFLGAVTNAVQNVVTQVQQTVEEKTTPRAPAAPSFSTIRDAFEQAPRPKLDLGARADGGGLNASLDLQLGGARVKLASFSASLAGVTASDALGTAGFTAKDGYTASTKLFGDTLGVSFRAVDGPATLGAVSVKAGGQECAMGIVPAAPAPLPELVYTGKERK